LRHHFEVDRRFIVLATLRALVDEGALPAARLEGVLASLGIDPDKPNPLNV
jgi:pyruvate dehydrogenase E1 component